MNRYTNAYSPFRRPGSMITSDYSLRPTYSVGSTPEAKAQYKPYSAPNAGTQARWTGDRNMSMGFPTLAAIGSQIGGGIDNRVDENRKQREKEAADREREERRSNRTTTVRRSGGGGSSGRGGGTSAGGASAGSGAPAVNDPDLTGNLDPNADPGAPSKPPGGFDPSFLENDYSQPSLFDDPGFSLPPSAPSGALGSQTNYPSTKGNNMNTPWAMKQERTGNAGVFGSVYPGSNNRGPAPTTRTGQPLLGPRNRRRR